MTTLTCIADYLSWTDMSVEEKAYGKDVVRVGADGRVCSLAVFMGVDMFGRLERRLDEGGNGVGGKKGL
ncbi:MAG: hypothetical protein M1836_006496 [Candelina mexicana]|nr:MAG: hypothetical protein M1836_006496 [Candelina mexicana]